MTTWKQRVLTESDLWAWLDTDNALMTDENWNVILFHTWDLYHTSWWNRFIPNN